MLFISTRQKKKSSRQGYTLIELLIVVAIIAILSTTVVSIGIPLKNQIVLDVFVHQVQSDLRLARLLALNNNQDYCLNFTKSKYQIYQQASSGMKTILESKDIPPSITLNRSATLGFTPSGTPKYSGSVQFNTLPHWNKKIIVAVSTGRVRIE